jgi:hypothetical protein
MAASSQKTEGAFAALAAAAERTANEGSQQLFSIHNGVSAPA